MHLNTLSFVFIFIFIFTSLLSQPIFSQQRFNTSVIPITKDQQTSLPKLTSALSLPQHFAGEGYLLLDLDSPFTWKDCNVRHIDIPCGLEEGCRFPIKCDQPLCKEAKSYTYSYTNPTCPPLNITDKWGCRICSVTPLNPISNVCKISQLTTDLANLYLTDGRNRYRGDRWPFGYEFVVSCAPTSLLRSFPKDVRGVASFSWSTLSFARQLSRLGIAEKFAICLPSSTDSLGVTFLGEGPYYFKSSKNSKEIDLRSVVSYTPMVRKSSNSLGYYIKINRILIKGTPISLPKRSTSSVKISTLVPYTVLRSDIYKALVAGISKAVSGSISWANPVDPFGFCVKAASDSAIGVPGIDLETESGKIWGISGGNLMKKVGNGVMCLAFLDGGMKVKDGIVIGTYQMEDNLMLFDLVNQKLGFSSSLLGRGISCSGFNFTEVGN